MALAVTSASLVGRGQARPPAHPLVLRWARPIPRVVGLALSPEGTRLAAITEDRDVILLDQNGETDGRERVAGATHAVVAPRGRLVAVYAARRPLYAAVVLLDRLGRRLGEIDTAASVHAVAVADDGRQVAIGVPEALLVASRQRGGWVTRRHRVHGMVTQVAFGPEGSLLVLTRRPEAIARLDAHGKLLWSLPLPPGSRATMVVPPGGETLFVAHEPPTDPSGEIVVRALSASGGALWEEVLPGRGATLRVADDAAALLIAYEHRLEHEARIVYEPRLRYVSLGSSRVFWEKGGGYTSALPATVGAGGAWVATLDASRSLRPPQIRLFGTRGERRWTYRCVAPVAIATSSRDGRTLAIYRTDSVIERIEVAGE